MKLILLLLLVHSSNVYVHTSALREALWAQMALILCPFLVKIANMSAHMLPSSELLYTKGALLWLLILLYRISDTILREAFPAMRLNLFRVAQNGRLVKLFG